MQSVSEPVKKRIVPTKQQELPRAARANRALNPKIRITKPVPTSRATKKRTICNIFETREEHVPAQRENPQPKAL